MDAHTIARKLLKGYSEVVSDHDHRIHTLIYSVWVHVRMPENFLDGFDDCLHDAVEKSWKCIMLKELYSKMDSMILDGR